VNLQYDVFFVPDNINYRTISIKRNFQRWDCWKLPVWKFFISLTVSTQWYWQGKIIISQRLLSAVAPILMLKRQQDMQTRINSGYSFA